MVSTLHVPVYNSQITAFDPPLTTIRLPRHEMAEKFAAALESSAKDPHAPGKIYTVKSSLVVRGTTGPAPKRR